MVSFLEIPPFMLHTMPQEMAHLCPVRAYADWLAASEINEGYIFRKMASGDRISQANEPMVHIFHLLHCICSFLIYRHQSIFWRCSATTSSTLGWIQSPMELTPFGEVVCSGCQCSSDGPFAVSVNGEVGALNSPI